MSEAGGRPERRGEEPALAPEASAGRELSREQITRLRAAPPRWGYKRVEPTPPAPARERQNPPRRGQVRTIERTRASGLWEATVLTTVGAVFAIALDASLGVFSTNNVRGVAEAGVFATHAFAAVLAFLAARAWYRSSPASAPVVGFSAKAARRWVKPSANAGVALFVPYVLLPAEAIRGWRRIARERGDRVPDPRDARRVEAEYAVAVDVWQKRIAQVEQAERRRFETTPLWHPVDFDVHGGATCVFGGTVLGWTAALTTMGTSLLGAGARVMVCDLSRRATLDVLAAVAQAAGTSISATVLPASGVESGLLDGIDWPELAGVLVEALHSAQRDREVSRSERRDDRAVIREVADCLAPSGPVSIARLRSALLVVQGAPDESARIDAAEYRRLSSLFNEIQRTHGGVLERVIRIERALRDFELLDPVSPGSGTLQRGGAADALAAAPGDAQLQLIGVDKLTDDLQHDCLADLLFQRLARRVRLGSVPADALIVLGADRIGREPLEALIDHAAAHSRTAVVLMFEHLREDAVELVGAGSGAAIFMRLLHPHEAAVGSELIGSEYRWVESSQTASVSRSLTRTAGSGREASLNAAFGFPRGASLGGSLTGTRSYTEALGDGAQYTVAETREREPVVDANTLLSLPLTGMIHVKVPARGQRQVSGLDCHPSIAFSARARQ